MRLQIVHERNSGWSSHIFLKAKYFYFCHFSLSFLVTVELKKNKSKSDKCKSTWLSRKYVVTELSFFNIQFEVPRVKSRQLFYKKTLWKGLSFYLYLGHFVRIWDFKWLQKVEKSLFWSLSQKRLLTTFLMQIIILNHIKLDSKILTNNQMNWREVYSLSISDIYSIVNRPKVSPNLKLCFTKMAHRATYMNWLCEQF